MDFAVMVGTHHKTGTVWMLEIFRSFGKRAGIPVLNFSRHCEELGIELDRCDELLFGYGLAFDGIILANHAEGFGLLSRNLPKNRARMFHVVRDPRDIVISSANYHVTSEEPWLHVPDAAFGGMTYQEKISTYDSFDERVLFEIENVSAHTVAGIRSLLGIDDIRIFKYEDLMSEPETFEQLFDFCGFDARHKQHFMKSVYDHSYFGETSAEDSEHGSDGRIEQWREKLSSRTRLAAEQAFGDVIKRLDYPLE